MRAGFVRDTLRASSPDNGGRHLRQPASISALAVASLLTIAAPAARGDVRPTEAPGGGGRTYSVSEHSPPRCTTHFCVHWVDSTDDAPNLDDVNGDGVPDTVERVATQLEAVHARENGPPPLGLGWAEPKPDAGRGGDDRTDAYLMNLHGGALGVTPGDGGSAADGSGSASGFVILERSLANPGQEAWLADIAAHEYCHVLQLLYDPFASGWMMESTATWMEDAAFPSLDLWPRVVPRWADHTETAFSEDSPTKAYGSAVWDFWLAQRYGDDIVRDVWAREHTPGRMTDVPARESLRVYDASIAAHGGRGFFDDFTRFAAALAEWRVPASGFTDPALLPDVERTATAAPDGATTSVALRDDGFALLDVPGSAAHAIRLEARLPETGPGAIALVGRAGSATGGTATVRLVQLPNGGAGEVTLERAARYERVTAVLIGADIGASSGSDTATARVVSIPNAGPSAAFDFSPRRPASNRAVAFDASASGDPDGQLVDYRWDLDGNGTFETHATTARGVARTYRPRASQVVGLRVTDDEGAVATTSRRFRVADKTPPRIGVAVARRQRLVRLARGLRLRVRSSERGRFTARLLLGRAAIGRTNGRLRAARPKTVRIRLAPRALRRIARRRHVRLHLRVRVADSAANASERRRRIDVRR